MLTQAFGMLPGISLCLVSYWIPLQSGTSWDSTCWSCLLLSQSVVTHCGCGLRDGAHCSGIVRCLLGVPGPCVSPFQSITSTQHCTRSWWYHHGKVCSAVLWYIMSFSIGQLHYLLSFSLELQQVKRLHPNLLAFLL